VENIKLSIAVNRLDNSQLSLEVIEFLEHTEFGVFLFYSELADFPVSLKNTILPIKEMYTFDGPIISTCLDTTQKLLRTFRCRKKFFYDYKLEWTKTLLPYNILYGVYCHPEITVLCRSDEENTLITNCWKKPVTLGELTDANLKQFV
jgi:hypothetical protein